MIRGNTAHKRFTLTSDEDSDVWEKTQQIGTGERNTGQRHSVGPLAGTKNKNYNIFREINLA